MFLISKLINAALRRRRLNDFSIPLFRLGWKSGLKDSTISICGLTKDNYKCFLSDRDYILGHPYNGAYSGIIDNKLWLPMLLRNYKEYLPKHYFFIDESGLLPLDDYPNKKGNFIRVPISEFWSLLENVSTLVLKHTHSSSGNGFMLIKQCGDIYYLNNKRIEKKELEQIILKLRQYIVTENVVQHSYSMNICSSSLNTIRFLCVWDYIKKEFFLARCYHRFGCNGSIVDNVGSGSGLCVFVDVKTGILKDEGNINYSNSGDVYAKDIIHPDHNIKLTGLQIPNFNEIKSKILEIANKNSFLRYVGFDVAVTEGGFKIIELNSLSSLDAVQQREGFLVDPRIRKVLKK